MKKIFTLLFASTLLFACSNGTEVSEINEVAVDQSVFDNSNLGIYKGVFTTLDGQNRATVFIELDGKSDPSVSFGFPDGTKAALTSNQKALKGQEINSMSFSGEDFEFDFSVEEDGTNPVVTNMTYKGSKGEAIVVKETSKSAVVAKTGTYNCISGCDNHPDLNDGGTQTFNTMAVTQGGMNNGAEFTLQVTLKNRTFPGTMTQTNCVTNLGATSCDLSGTIQGGSGPASVDGDHIYGTAPGDDCSDLEGTWVYNSSLFGQSTMTWETDRPIGTNCFN